ncbi:kanadaptin isoform X2 [Sesamum indicum]|uniref:Kanadaptin isoform X2 n=1 Tax=Sesamum indicum TaxID=4182 RepID=A0A8M8V6D4_SESIN|nr:kanadaptin isoform X2 [Sesamum indicum]
MTTTMGPPPPPKDSTAEPSTCEATKSTAMAPPPPRNLKSSESGHEPESSENLPNEPDLNPPRTHTSENLNRLPDSTNNSTNGTSADAEKKQEQRNNNAAVPYTIPAWSAPPGHQFVLEVLKDGAIIDQFDVNKKGAYMFGRVDLCDFVLEHPTISRFHAVLQFKSNGGAYLYDLGSTHGTFINKNQVNKRVYVDLHVGDVIRFGHSTRLYIFQGPSDLMPPEADLKSLRKAKIRQEMQDMEASLLRAKLEASRADGISWGMREDAVEDTEDEVDEITWQTYKGQLTEKQEKTRDKVIKRLEKIAHMKKEIDAIRAKDIAQGGLTQGQQTQIARNEQRISQIMEELENLEETLNESIRESIGARAGKSSRGKKKGNVEDEEEDYLSDEDEFYDRTQKPSKHKSGENQSIETADSLLDKKDTLVKQIEDKEKLLLNEDRPTETNAVTETGDALDAYMSTVSSQLVLDNKEKLRKELSTLQSELDRILYLLRIADPTGEAAKKRVSKEQKPKAIGKENPVSDAGGPRKREKHTVGPSSENGEIFGREVKSSEEKASVEAKSESDVNREEPESVADESTATVFTVPKPQWLGAVGDTKKQEITQELPAEQEQEQFVDYKDRGKILNKTDSSLGDQGIEAAAPGLIIRKRKEVEKSEVSEVKESKQTVGSEFKAEDAIALLLKHSRGYHASDEEDRPVSEEVLLENEGRKDGKRPKRVLGPERSSFLSEPDYSSWVPPEGQSGDGRTTLNDRFGY